MSISYLSLSYVINTKRSSSYILLELIEFIFEMCCSGILWLFNSTYINPRLPLHPFIKLFWLMSHPLNSQNLQIGRGMHAAGRPPAWQSLQCLCSTGFEVTQDQQIHWHGWSGFTERQSKVPASLLLPDWKDPRPFTSALLNQSE